MQVLEGIEGLLRKQEIALKNDEASSIRAFKDKLGEVEAQVVVWEEVWMNVWAIRLLAPLPSLTMMFPRSPVSLHRLQLRGSRPTMLPETGSPRRPL